MHIFSAKIYKVGIIRYVDVPVELSREIGDGVTHLPVKGEIESVPVVTTLVSRGKGCYRMAIHSDIRKKLRVDTGAAVEVAIERDKESREPVLPPALVLALHNAPREAVVFRGMTTALRRQIVRYLTAPKQHSTVERRVTKFIRRLQELAKEKADRRYRRPYSPNHFR